MRINLRNFTEQEELPLENVKNVISLEYDLQDGCIFYGDTTDRKIYKQCLNGSMVETLVQKTDTVEGNFFFFLFFLYFFILNFFAFLESFASFSGKQNVKKSWDFWQ